MERNISAAVLTAGLAFVSAISAVGVSVAEFALVDALGCPVAARVGAVELVLGACDGRAVLLVGAVGTILVPIASPSGYNERKEVNFWRCPS